MIKSLKIQNYTLLKDVNIDFKEGFTVISGETGAGKSILLDALGLLLGKRVDRFSADRSSGRTIIEGVFSIKKSKSSFFKKNNIDFQEIVVVRREINPSGKSKAFINKSPVLLNVLSDFGNKVIEIHAQHQAILLKDEAAQFRLVDRLAQSEDILLFYQSEFEKYNELQQELALIKSSGSLSVAELDFLKYQSEELDLASLKIGEKEDIEHQLLLLENIEGVVGAISDSDQILNNERGVLSQLSELRRKLLGYDIFDKLYERVESVIIELNDMSSDISKLNNNLKLDPNELIVLKSRLDIINSLLQKHSKKTVKDLLNYHKVIKDKIRLSASFETALKDKKKKIENQFLALREASLALNEKRNKILPRLKKDVETHLISLGMPFAQFTVQLNHTDIFNELGNSTISFLFSANKGSALLDIAKVASGGELSRLMLAVKHISAKSSDLDILIFDEIDIGVSGEIASLMGNMMREISRSTQLIAISHLPQVASKANQHLKVVKNVVDSTTISNVVNLDDEERVMEIAKLLSGKEVSSEAFENARVLLNQ